MSITSASTSNTPSEFLGSDTESKGNEQKLLEARISVLEKQVLFLLKINGLDLSELRNYTDEQLLRLYQDAVHMLALVTKKLDLEIIERWSEYFIQLTEHEMIRLQDLVNFDHTWEPFYILCTKMMTQLRQSKEVTESIRVQQLWAVLNKGKKNLRDAAVIICQKYAYKVTPQARAILQEEHILGIV